MKCRCEECQGTGKVRCEECDGKGSLEAGIDSLKLYPQDPHYSELLELQRDANRVISQAAELIRINPNRSESYAGQLEVALVEINSQAEKLRKKI